MALTSFVGAALMTYGALALLHFHEIFDGIAWSYDNATLLTVLCGVGTVLGFLFQFYVERRRVRRRKDDDEDEDEEPSILARIGLGGKSKSRRRLIRP